ncbi:hypothetical protein PV325_014135, partial [Microctonus aethiopoides]
MLSDSANNVKVSRFLQQNSFAEFYGFEETEVRSILEKAELTEYFAGVKEKYDGYMAKSTCGEDIQIYSPWAILNYINDKKLNNYWAARVPEVIKKQIGHSKIRPKLLRLMSREIVEIKYIPKLNFKNMQRLCEVVQEGEINDDDADLFLQFLYEMGFFRLNNHTDNNLWLEIPNDSVHSEIDLYIRHYDSVTAYYNNTSESIENFIESVKNVGDSCNENSVRDLAKSIEGLFTSGKRAPTNEFEVRRVVDAYLLQYFIEVASERYTADGNRCDTIVFDRRRGIFFIFEWKLAEVKKFNKHKVSQAGHKQIFEKGYHTLLDEKSIKKIFKIDPSIVKKRLYFGAHVATTDFITFITYSSDINDEPKDVCS